MTYKTMTAEEYLAVANHAEKAKPELDKWIDEIRKAAGLPERALLRQAIMLLGQLGNTVPTSDHGLDAYRLFTPTNSVIPPWRECIEVYLGVSLDPPEEPQIAEESQDIREAVSDAVEAGSGDGEVRPPAD